MTIVEGSHDYNTQAAEAKNTIQKKPDASITQSLLIERPLTAATAAEEDDDEEGEKHEEQESSSEGEEEIATRK